MLRATRVTMMTLKSNGDWIRTLRPRVDEEVDMEDRDKFNMTALHGAAYNGDIALCKVLLQRGAEVNARDIWRNTPLHYAVAHTDDVQLPSLLIRHGAEVNAQGRNGDTVLHFAARHKIFANDVIDLLLSAGAVPYTRNDDGANYIDANFGGL